MKITVPYSDEHPQSIYNSNDLAPLMEGELVENFGNSQVLIDLETGEEMWRLRSELLMEEEAV